MAKTIKSHDLLTTLIKAINEGYTGRITMMEKPNRAGIIILMKGGQIYKITGSEREGLSALTQLIKWKTGFVMYEDNVPDSYFQGLKPIKIEGFLHKIIEEQRKRMDEIMSVFYNTAIRYLTRGKPVIIRPETRKTFREIMENHVSAPALVYMASVEKRILIMLNENSMVIIGEDEKLTMEEAMKLSTVYEFSYFIYELTEEDQVLLLQGLIDIASADVLQNDVLTPPIKPQDVRNIIQDNNVVIFYSTSEDGKMETLPCVRSKCFEKTKEFINFFKKEVRYVAW